MAPLLARKTLVALGHASQPDAFQCGREAAQMALSQLPGNQLSIGFLFAPDSVHFNDLIEGARLVTGRHLLVAVPVSRVFSGDMLMKDAAMVLLLQSSEHHMTAAALSAESGVLAAASGLISRIRSQRGNKRKFYSHQGLLVFNNHTPNEFNELITALSADGSLDAWTAGIRPAVAKPTPLICHDDSILNGAVALECLSQNPWGYSQVAVDSFQGQAGIYANAVKAALREARHSMGAAEPAFGFVFFNSAIVELPQNELKQLTDSAESVLGSVPLIGLSTTHQFFRDSTRTVRNHNNAVSVLLGPV